MKRWITLVALAIAASVLICPTGMAAMAKPKAKAKPKAIPHIVQGTTQLSGENAQLGTMYTLGKTEPFNITLKSAEYSVEPILIGDRWR